MSTSWALKRDAIITAALRKLAVVSGNVSPESYQITNASEALNALVKALQTDGMPVWAISSYSFPTVANTATYEIGTGQTLNTDMPMKIIQAWRSDSAGATNIPLNIYTGYNYNLLPNSAGPSTPVNLWYTPKEVSGTIALWPTPINSSFTITIRYQRPFNDLNSSTDDLDFPSYWTEAVIYALAVRLAPEYGVPIPDRQLLISEAEKYHAMAVSFGTEEGSLYFSPDWAYGR